MEIIMSDEIIQLEEGLAQAQTQQEKITALNKLAFALINTQTKRALELAEKAYKLSITDKYSEQPYTLGQGASLVIQSVVNFVFFGKPNVGLEQSYQAFDLLSPQESTHWIVHCLRAISRTHNFLGDYSEALNYGLQALKICHELGDKALEAQIFDGLAMIYANSGEVDRALEYYSLGISLMQELKIENVEAGMLNNAAYAMFKAEDYERALDFATQSVGIARRLKIEIQLIMALDTLGQIHYKMGNEQIAEKTLNEGVALSSQSQFIVGEMTCLMSLGRVKWSQQKAEQAKFNFHKALNIAEKISDRSTQMGCHEKLAQIAELQEAYKQAVVHHRALHSIYVDAHNESESKKLAVLKVKHEVETSRQEAEIYRLRNEDLKNEITERKHAESKLKILAETDSLTEMNNRRYFFSISKILFLQENQFPISLLVIDIDKFKEVNDSYGHLIGDDVIKHIAQTIKGTVRDQDVSARFGGDEFVILLPKTKGDMAKKIAERLRKSIKQYTLSGNQEEIQVTTSIGLAVISSRTESVTVDWLIEKADHALYLGKREGRDQVCVNSQAFN